MSPQYRVPTGRLNWCMNFFKEMSAENVADISLTYLVEFLRFCFLGILQEELDETGRIWNNHFIRKRRNAECPWGRPMCCFIPFLLWEDKVAGHFLLRQMRISLYHIVKCLNFLAALTT